MVSSLPDAAAISALSCNDLKACVVFTPYQGLRISLHNKITDSLISYDFWKFFESMSFSNNLVSSKS